MSYFGDDTLEQAILDWIEMEMRDRGADFVSTLAALGKVIEAIVERHRNA